MNSLPIESTRWREHLKQRIHMETAILRVLIQWGMAESASDVCRSLEEHFGDLVLDAACDTSLVRSLFDLQGTTERLFESCFERRTFEPAKFRVAGLTQERLHDGLLTGFEELSLEILQCYEGFLFRSERSAQSGKAA